MADWEKLFELSRRYGFVIASDECYSEIYFRDDPPLGGLEAAVRVGLADFKNLVVFTSLSKRSNVPGMRSGFVAGDADILKQFLLYRTYHGCAMSGMVQAASIAAWNDEAHVVANRDLYREKFAAVTPMLAEVLDVRLPDASFLSLGGRAGRRRRRLRAGLAGSIQCDRLAGKLSGASRSGRQSWRRPHPDGPGGGDRGMCGGRTAHCGLRQRRRTETDFNSTEFNERNA